MIMASVSPMAICVSAVFVISALPVSAAEPLPASVAQPSDSLSMVSIADGSDRFSIQLGSRVGGIKGSIRILEQSKDGALNVVETVDAANPDNVQLIENGSQLVVKSARPISAGSTWTLDLSGATGCQPISSAPPVRGLWKSTSGIVPASTGSKASILVAQACIPIPLVPVSPVAFAVPSTAAVATAAAASSLPLILLGAAAAIGAVTAIILSNGSGSSSSGFTTSR